MSLFSPYIFDKLTELSINCHWPQDLKIQLSVFNILINTTSTKDSLELLNALLTKYGLLKRNPCVYLRVNRINSTREDLMLLVTKQIKQLHLGRMEIDPPCTLFTSSEFPYCPEFTHFCAKDCIIDDSVPLAVIKVVKDGNLPNLRRIDLTDCQFNDCEWPEVPEFLLQARKEWQTDKIISQLTELTLDECFNINCVILRRLKKL